jgi:hypothetical protein
VLNRSALNGIDVNLDVFNTLMINNKAIGFGANPTQAARLHRQRHYNVHIEGTIICPNSAREGRPCLVRGR